MLRMLIPAIPSPLLRINPINRRKTPGDGGKFNGVGPQSRPQSELPTLQSRPCLEDTARHDALPAGPQPNIVIGLNRNLEFQRITGHNPAYD